MATVYYGYALRAAKSDGADYEAPVILGSVMAHEVGHLLLGPCAHAPAGIMQAQWKRDHLERAMKGQILFMSDEAEKMRSNASSRLATEIANMDFAALRTTPEPPGITISVHDYADVSADTLPKAEEEARRILQRARMRRTWLNCSHKLELEKIEPANAPLPDGTHLVLKILPVAKNAQFNSAVDVLGTAPWKTRIQRRAGLPARYSLG
jgi:hypothetical protein